MDIPLWLPLCFFGVALLYSMVGFGGGSSYLAILVLAGVTHRQIPATALVCNLIVTGGGVWHFYRAGHFRVHAILPFVVLSIPMAYLGGLVEPDQEIFSWILAIALMAVGVRLFLPDPRCDQPKEIAWPRAWAIGLPVGALLGCLAGVVGIGGGIFLSPLLLMLRWANIKEAAAGASMFIVVNSAAGLLGQLHHGNVHVAWILPLGLAVLLGGQIGSRLGAYRVPKLRLQQLLALLMLFVGTKIIWEIA